MSENISDTKERLPPHRKIETTIKISADAPDSVEIDWEQVAHNQAQTIDNYGIELDGAYETIESLTRSLADAHNRAIEQAAEAIEQGGFVHENAPDALWAKKCAAIIRKLRI